MSNKNASWVLPKYAEHRGMEMRLTEKSVPWRKL
jgi:hypothetical protein